MPMPSPKELKKIAKACREAGIKVYKGEGFELTFSEEAPEPKRKQKSPAQAEPDSPANHKFTTDSLSDEELLLWSAGSGGMPLNFEQEET